MAQQQDKITVTWNDLTSRRVDQRLKEQEALSRNREYARMDESSVPVPAVAPHVPLWARVWRNSIFALALFGLVGGLVAWGCGALVQFKDNGQADAVNRLRHVEQLADAQRRNPGLLSPEQAWTAIESATEQGRRENPYFALMVQGGDAARRMERSARCRL